MPGGLLDQIALVWFLLRSLMWSGGVLTVGSVEEGEPVRKKPKTSPGLLRRALHRVGGALADLFPSPKQVLWDIQTATGFSLPPPGPPLPPFVPSPSVCTLTGRSREAEEVPLFSRKEAKSFKSRLPLAEGMSDVCTRVECVCVRLWCPSGCLCRLCVVFLFYLSVCLSVRLSVSVSLSLFLSRFVSWQVALFLSRVSLCGKVSILLFLLSCSPVDGSRPGQWRVPLSQLSEALLSEEGKGMSTREGQWRAPSGVFLGREW